MARRALTLTLFRLVEPSPAARGRRDASLLCLRQLAVVRLGFGFADSLGLALLSVPLTRSDSFLFRLL